MAFNLTLEQSLIFAAHAHGVASAKNALEKGVDINSRDPFGHTALYWAAEAGDLQLVKFLVEHGANLNASDEANKHTAVTIAVDKKNMAIAEFLIESGAGAL